MSCKVLGVLDVSKLPIRLYSGLFYARFKDFIRNAENLVPIIDASRIISLIEIVPNRIEARLSVVSTS